MEGRTMRVKASWYRRAVLAIDRHGRRLNVDQIAFIADLIDRKVTEFTRAEQHIIWILCGRYVAKGRRPQSVDHDRSSKSRKPQADE
jgi:hypothetical protein